jgi:hypothetical protein
MLPKMPAIAACIKAALSMPFNLNNLATDPESAQFDRVQKRLVS